jgi:HPt (histidine-containing phosphotransfer) domain-containing protein
MIVPIKAIAEELGIEEDEVMEFLQDFLDYTETEDLVGLTAALNSGDCDLVEKRAHSIKGAALNLKLVEVAGLSAQIEKKGLATDLEGVPELVDLLKDELKGVREFVQNNQ